VRLLSFFVVVVIGLFCGITGGAAYCMASVLLAGLRLERSKELFKSLSPMLKAFIAWTTSQLQSSGSRTLGIVLPALMILIPDAQVRHVFDESGGIGYLTRHLRHDHLGDTRVSVQQLYELSFCLWLMSYDVETSERIRSHFHRHGTVSVLCDLAASSPREKVVRCALSTLRNLATCKAAFQLSSRDSAIQGSKYLMEMVGCDLMKSVASLRTRQWTDPDIMEGRLAIVDIQKYFMTIVRLRILFLGATADLDVLYSVLHEAHRDLTRFDVYKSELEAGHLKWGLVHTEKFFKENARLMEGPKGDFALVRVSTLVRFVFFLQSGSI